MINKTIKLDKLITKIILIGIISLFFSLTIQTAMAAKCTSTADCGQDEVCFDGFCENKYLGDLIPRPGEGNTDAPEELQAIGALPEVTAEQAIAEGIKTVLGWSMALTIIAIVFAAMYYLQARGQEEDISKAKNIILYLIIGMIIMAAAYGLVAGIAQFEFFEAAP